MIILDTNVVSELMKVQPSTAVLNWINAQDAAGLYVTVISLGEVSFGLQAMAEGRRRQALEAAFDGLIASAFQDRVLPLEEEAARCYGRLMAHRKTIGRPMNIADGLIASIAFVQGFAVATRDVRDFDDCGLTVIDPFEVGRGGFHEGPS